jgi:hypothetical protein
MHRVVAHPPDRLLAPVSAQRPLEPAGVGDVDGPVVAGDVVGTQRAGGTVVLEAEAGRGVCLVKSAVEGSTVVSRPERSRIEFGLRLAIISPRIDLRRASS